LKANRPITPPPVPKLPKTSPVNNGRLYPLGPAQRSGHCLPILQDRCTLGFYPEYVIIPKTKKHIKAGIDFARANNIRLVIRNTGHDFMGRSTGYGSLAINTHSFKDVEFITKYTGPGGWTGGAVKLGAGIQ
jgi:hypothetical protein